MKQTTYIAQSVALRGRDGGATAELGDDLAGCLRASGGGGDKPHVLAPAIAFSCKDYGADAAVDVAPTMRAMNHHGSHANAGGQLAVCVTGSVTHTLRAEGFDASEDGTGRGQPIVAHDVAGTMKSCSTSGGFSNSADHAAAGYMVPYSNVAVRRLMPIECEALQGFPAGYTDVPVGKKRAADGPRYKQLGNSWAVTHAHWVGSRINDWVAANPPRVRPAIEMEYDRVLLIWAMVG